MRTSFKKAAFVFATTVILAASSLPAKAADDIAVIDIDSILRNSLAAKSGKQQLDAKSEQYRNEMKKIEDKLHKEEQAIIEQRNLLSPEAMEQKRKEFTGKVNSAQKEVQQKKILLNVAYETTGNNIVKAIRKIVEKMAKEKGYKLVVTSNQLQYASPDLDITQPVLQQLDKDLPSVKVDFTLPTRTNKK